jgi:hypothetical protein
MVQHILHDEYDRDAQGSSYLGKPRSQLLLLSIILNFKMPIKSLIIGEFTIFLIDSNRIIQSHSFIFSPYVNKPDYVI